MNISRAFTYIFDDPHWVKKMFIGGMMIFACIFIIPIPLVLGYMGKTLKNASKRQKDVLPEWNDWVGLFKTGFLLLVVITVYGIVFGLIVSLFRMIPNVSSYEWILQAVFSFILPVPLLLYVVSGSLKEAFDFEKIKNFVVQNFLDLFIIYVVGFILIPISVSGMLVLIVGMVFTSFYGILVRVYLYGNLYRTKKREKLI